MTTETHGFGGGRQMQPSVPELVMMDAVELSQAIRSKRVSCAEVMACVSGPHRAHQPQGERHRLAARSGRVDAAGGGA